MLAKRMALEVRLCRILISAENCNKQSSFARSKYLNETLGTRRRVSWYVQERSFSSQLFKFGGILI